MNRLQAVTVLISLVLVGGAPIPAFSAAAPGGSPPPFPRPPSLAPAVHFWKEVFTDWESDQIVYHDGFDLDRIYEVHRLPPADGTLRRDREREKLRARWKEDLARELETLARPDCAYDTLTGRRARLFRIWDRSTDPATYRAAAENVRSQRGIREGFLAGVSRSARYVDAFRDIFRAEGVPEELLFLPHVESSYRWDARSSVGALGMWQFMSATARKYDIRVDEAVDERLDPYTAARAAARYLKSAHTELGTWPLAITSYNHGVDGIKNAVRETGTTDIARIIRDYRGPLFGFAGRNFYPEFLAAMEGAQSLLDDPGDLSLDPAADFDTFTLPAYVELPTAARTFGVTPDELARMNPAVSRSARRGEVYLPKGYELKIPAGLGESAGALFAGLPPSERPLTPPQRTYRVRSGDNLGAIATRFRTSVGAIQRLNGIRNPNYLRVGTLLRLPH